ncbi:tyrosinase family oxidase copper chaperone [Streptomyces apocyni]|uniref:tyrosinase family oxidase copper chaperone n=1 Tax=Streptomyces apocyni TaxID=2654677 RepID=UPI00389AD16B
MKTDRPVRGVVTRRSALLVALGAVPTAIAIAVTARRSRSTGPDSGEVTADGAPGPAPDGFDEMYRGRRIRGVPGADRAAPGRQGSLEVTVDGRPLHLMRRADNTYLSMVDHYAAYPTPLEAARGAVDELHGQPLRLHTT